MKKTLFLFLIATYLLTPTTGKTQVNEDAMGAWYMYFFNATYKESRFGVQGDIQYRNWNLGGDLEQLLLRGGLTYKPKNADIKLTLGYGNITTGTYGESNTTSGESRIYQEALFPSKIGNCVFLNHRIRYEQRFVENQDFRTRYRYNMFINVPLNNAEFTKGTFYLSLYDEIFINGERNIGNNNTVQIFDRNRLYFALGYVLVPKLKVQLGIMNQTTNNVSKNQLQVSLHQKF